MLNNAGNSNNNTTKATKAATTTAARKGRLTILFTFWRLVVVIVVDRFSNKPFRTGFSFQFFFCERFRLLVLLLPRCHEEEAEAEEEEQTTDPRASNFMLQTSDVCVIEMFSSSQNEKHESMRALHMKVFYSVDNFNYRVSQKY